MVDRDAVEAANKNADGRKPKCGNSRKPKNADIAASRSAVIAANKKMRLAAIGIEPKIQATKDTKPHHCSKKRQRARTEQNRVKLPASNIKTS